MKYLTNDKLLIVGAGGRIGSNLVQSALMLGLTPNICLYDIYEPGVHGVYDEMEQCAVPGANLSYYAPAVEDMNDPEKVAEAAKKAFTGAKYIISSGGAPRKAGMTRDVTALTALIHSGLKPNQLTSLAALDSTRLQQALAHEFGVQQDKVTGAHTYGGHGEQMAVFASQVKVDGKPLSEMGLSKERWEEIKQITTQGGSRIIKLRGRSSFQSPAYNAVKMIEAAMGGEPFTLPAGCYANLPELGIKDVMMALPTTIDKTGVHYTTPSGTEEEMADLQKSYKHLCDMRQEVIDLGIVPPVEKWNEDNKNL